MPKSKRSISRLLHSLWYLLLLRRRNIAELKSENILLKNKEDVQLDDCENCLQFCAWSVASDSDALRELAPSNFTIAGNSWKFQPGILNSSISQFINY